MKLVTKGPPREKHPVDRRTDGRKEGRKEGRKD